MPRIPTLQNQATLRGLPNVQAREQPAGGLQALGRGISDIGDAVNHIRIQERAKADDAAVKEGARLLEERENSLLFDPQNGAYARRGRNAFDLQSQVLPDYDKSAAEIEGGLTTPRQKTIFRAVLNERRGNLLRDLNRKEMDERERFYDETDESSISTTAETAANYAGRDDRVDEALANQRAIINTAARRKGWDDITKENQIRTAETRTHEAVVNRLLLDDQFDKAGQYLAKRAPQMNDPVVESLQRRILIEEDQSIARVERQQKRAAESIVKEGDRLLSRGQLTSQWIEQNRGTLDSQDYRYFLRKISAGGDDESGPSDVIVYSDLRDRAGRGEDVRSDARDAVRRGQIRSSDFDRILGEVEGSRPSWYRRGSQFISTSAAVSDLNPDPAAAQRKAQMLDDWDTWARENPKATETEANGAYRRIVDEYAIINTRDFLLTKRAPRYLIGNRNEPDIEGTEVATVKAFEDGTIDRQEFERQAALIAEWRRAFAQQQKQKTPK